MKKGQITVFIIIGILILATIGVVIYLTRAPVEEFEAERPKVFKAPQEVQPIKDYVEACISRLGKDGLVKIGDSGGYVDSSHLISIPGSPTSGQAVEFSPGSELKTAYWWHMTSPNECESNCEFTSLRPSIADMEQQLGEYITTNLQSCLNNFESFKEQGMNVIELSEPQITATIARDDVFFSAEYPLRIERPGQTFSLEDYYISMDLNFREIYQLSTDITNLQIENGILEQATETIITIFSGLSDGQLPPFRELEFGPPGAPKYWIQYETEQKVKELLTAYIPLIQVYGVRNYNMIVAPAGTRDSDFYQQIHNRQFLIPLADPHPTLQARLSYLDWWKPYFDLNCNGAICQPDSGTMASFLPFSLDKYEFAYDISYPVLVEIRNPTAFNGEGYSFRFFLEQNMRNSRSFTSTERLPPEEEAPAPSIFCDPDQRTATANLEIVDSITRQPITGASIAYTCGDDSCPIGKTEAQSIQAKLPQCLNGKLSVMKQGYAMHAQLFDAAVVPGDATVSIPLSPIRTYDVSIKNYEIRKQSKWAKWKAATGGSLRPSEDQETTIILERVGKEFDAPFVAVAQLTGTEKGTLDLIPGKYKVTINSYLKPESLEIPSDNRCTKSFRKFPLGPKERKCFDVPSEPIIFNREKPLPYGGAELEHTFDAADLAGAKTIEFRQYVVALDKVQNTSRVMEDMEQINKIQFFVESNKDRVRPVIRR